MRVTWRIHIFSLDLWIYVYAPSWTCVYAHMNICICAIINMLICTYEYIYNKSEDMTVCTKNAASLKSSKSENSNSSVQIQIEPKSQFEFALRVTKRFSFSIWWISGMLYLRQRLSYGVVVGWLIHVYATPCVRVKRLIHACDTKHSCVWHDSLMRVTRLILISAWSCWGTTHDSWMCDTTPLCAWHKTFILVTQLILVPASSCRGGTTHECVGHNSSVCVTRLIYACDLTHWYLSVEGSRDQSYMCVTKLIRIRETTTGWRRPTGCLKLQVIFLQKSH